MNADQIHSAELGLLLWVDNRLCNVAQAYQTVTTRLYYSPDDRLDSTKVAYSSPFKSWVYDSGVQGAHIPDSISGDRGLILEHQSGLEFDFENGRVLLDASFGTNRVITGTYSFKEFNVYETNDGLEQLIIENKYYLNSRFARPETGITPYDLVTPCVFVNVSELYDKPWAFGGDEMASPTATMVIMAETPYQLKGAMSCFSKAARKYFPQIELYNDPINESGCLKTGYNYSILAQNASQDDLVFIESVRASAISDKIPTSEALYVGIVDFRLQFLRND